MSEWISVKDKLPTEYLQEVLTYLITKEICLCCYNTVSKRWTYNCTCNIHEDECDCHNAWPDNKREIKDEVDVTHWMPLPRPPEKGASLSTQEKGKSEWANTKT